MVALSVPTRGLRPLDSGFVSANSRPSAARTVALSVPTRGLRPLEWWLCQCQAWVLPTFLSDFEALFLALECQLTPEQKEELEPFIYNARYHVERCYLQTPQQSAKFLAAVLPPPTRATANQRLAQRKKASREQSLKLNNNNKNCR
ncbi:hypothetical protein Ddc_24719 [Ditylenchus destructor]|nr:hypothetical protein Ddc_24719 [Ditylenchus destructor]